MSLRARLVLAFTYVLVLVIVALEVPLALNLSKRVDAEIKSEAHSQTELVAAGASSRMNDERQLKRLVKSSGQTLGGRVIVVDARGRVLADSFTDTTEGDDYSSRPEIRTALSGRDVQGERHSDSLNADILFTAEPVPSGRRTVGAVRVTESVDAVNDEQRSDVTALIGVGLVALALGLVVAWLLAGSLAKPLRGLAGAARRVAGGDLDARAKVEGSSEQREVATAFNDMTTRVGSTLRGQREFVANASHQLRTPLTGLRLRLEAAALKSRDPAVERELTAAEHETERLARLLSELLTLAGGGERPAAAAARRGRPDRRRLAPLGGARGAVGPRAAGRARPAVGRAASAEDLAAILDNLTENALDLLTAGHDRHAHLGERRQGGAPGRARRGPGTRGRRVGARLPALLPRLGEPRRRGRHRARPRGRRVARRALGRRGHAHEPVRGRRPRRGDPRRRAGFTES